MVAQSDAPLGQAQRGRDELQGEALVASQLWSRRGKPDGNRLGSRSRDLRNTPTNSKRSLPTSVDPLGKCEYSNLLYACRTCNAAKTDVLAVPNPCEVAFGDCLRIKTDGEVEALNADGRKLGDVLRLNSPVNVEQRSRWMRMLQALRGSHPDLYEEFMAFPIDLPDLRHPRKRVPSNSKPEGAENCYLLLRPA